MWLSLISIRLCLSSLIIPTDISFPFHTPTKLLITLLVLSCQFRLVLGVAYPKIYYFPLIVYFVYIPRWNYMIGYNVCVILMKTILQIPGCIFMNEMQIRACWLVQLFGIFCIQKFTPTQGKLFMLKYGSFYFLKQSKIFVVYSKTN